jgi:hypothetical protein
MNVYMYTYTDMCVFILRILYVYLYAKVYLYKIISEGELEGWIQLESRQLLSI